MYYARISSSFITAYTDFFRVCSLILKHGLNSLISESSPFPRSASPILTSLPGYGPRAEEVGSVGKCGLPEAGRWAAVEELLGEIVRPTEREGRFLTNKWVMRE